MTLTRERQSSKRVERQKLIQDIKQQNPEITDEQLSRYDIDDLRKIKLATAPKAQTEQLSQVEKYNRKFGTDKFNPNEMPEEVSRIRGMQYGGKMKKKYQSKGKVTSNKDYAMSLQRLAHKLAVAENTRGGDKIISDTDFRMAMNRVSKLASGTTSLKQAEARINDYIENYSKPHPQKGFPTQTEKQRMSEPIDLNFQYGGIADMSAAPMVKQQRQRKRRASSGFRAKYAKGGGVRASKYKL